MSPRNLVGVVHLPFLRSIVNGGDFTLMHISYIFITIEKQTKSLYTYNGCLSLEIVRCSNVFIKHDGIMSLKKCTPCTSDVYVVSLMYKFEKIDNFRISLYFTTHASYDKYDASVM